MLKPEIIIEETDLGPGLVMITSRDRVLELKKGLSVAFQSIGRSAKVTAVAVSDMANAIAREVQVATQKTVKKR